MCTVIVLNNCVNGHPLIVAANRDEFYNRPASPPSVIDRGELRIIRPWDNERAGTWIGASRGGWFVALTNQDMGSELPKASKSRGWIVDECLRAGNHRDAARVLAGLDPTQVNPFNIVFGRPGSVFLCRVLLGHAVEMQPLCDGVHVISNDCWGSMYDSKTALARQRVVATASTKQNITDVVASLVDVLSDHTLSVGNEPYQSLCVHADEDGFGTRSTSIITVTSNNDVLYYYVEGHPCERRGIEFIGSIAGEQK